MPCGKTKVDLNIVISRKVKSFDDFVDFPTGSSLNANSFSKNYKKRKNPLQFLNLSKSKSKEKLILSSALLL